MSAHLQPDLSRRRFLLRGDAPAPRIKIEAHCLALGGIYCDSCRDACETGALRFVPQLGAVPQPVLAVDLCSQCGDCVPRCPQDAIRVQAKTSEAAHG